MIPNLGLAIGALVLAYSFYLRWRIATERARVSARVERLLAGRCRPAGPRDVMLDGCR